MNSGLPGGDNRTGISDKRQHPLPPDLIHDLRTPIGHVLGYAELLKEQVEEAGHSDLLPFINKIHTAAEQLLELINVNFQSSRETKP